MDSETFSVRNQGVVCALAWVTIARDSESDYPFYPVVQFRSIRAGHLCCQISSWLTKLSLSVSSGSYCTSENVGFQSYGNTLAALYNHYPIVWTVKHSVFGTRVLSVL